jgi:hypothetical protein
MASEGSIAKWRKRYRRLLGFYPAEYRERFGEEMEQTFNDLCRERARAGRGFLRLAIFIFAETAAGIVRENANYVARFRMKKDGMVFLNVVKFGAAGMSALAVAGIVTLMILARGTGEDIAGIVAMGLLVMIVSGVVAIVATVLQRRARGQNS